MIGYDANIFVETSRSKPHSFEIIKSLSKKDQLPVAIIGGGLGGTALALALQQRNIPVKVFEKDASFSARRQGYALTMQQAATTLRSLGLREEICSIGKISFINDDIVLMTWEIWSRDAILCPSIILLRWQAARMLWTASKEWKNIRRCLHHMA